MADAPLRFPERLPRPGELVQVRSRKWLVEEVIPGPTPEASPLVRIGCADDDNVGRQMEVYWNLELDRRILETEAWDDLAANGFDHPALFSAFLHTLRWNCVTATDPNLFQAPFRAGIKIDAYQMEPLRKALKLPRVNLFIADDTGLGKTIEAGLIARELLLRKKAKTIVVAAPPSVLEQWRGELEHRFGLVFEILDRSYVARMRRDRGFGVNPWRTHSRFLVSHRLLAEPAYAEPMREWLGELLPGSLLILDEAHHAAPSSGGRYGIESKFTRAVRDLARRFEHRLFLSATPHNGHSSSFSTLLEILDPHRFTRGVKIRGKSSLNEVMVRRLKEDIRAVQGGFPKRVVERVVLENLPDDSPELVLSRLLADYRALRETRFKEASRSARTAAGLLVVGLQQRLLSSTEAFARSLHVHRRTVERHWEKEQEKAPAKAGFVQEQAELYTTSSDAEDERADLRDDQLEAEEVLQLETVTAASEAAIEQHAAARDSWRKEQDLLERMTAIAEEHRTLPDAKVGFLLNWLREHLCPDLPPLGERPSGNPPRWLERRVLIFTENRQGTKNYLREILEHAIEHTEEPQHRIEVIDGLVASQRRKEIQRRFNTHPSKDPLRILIATDAAREGLNFQAHCTDLFHFDLPWNPGRIEQRNGRIDRKLQPAAEVRCHYFVLPQRAEDRVLDVLVRKTETIKRELGSLSKVLEDEIELQLNTEGIRHEAADAMAERIEAVDLDEQVRRTAAEELDAARERQEDLKGQIERCRTLLARSREWVQFQSEPFRKALSASLEILGAEPLQRVETADGATAWEFPRLDRRAQTDASWAATIDTLRPPRPPGQKVLEWRKEALPRPIVFEDAGVLTDDTVHMHLEQRVAQRLLARFRSQGFVYHDLSRACLAQSRDSIPRLILLGRLSLYGRGAERLHEELVPLTARWIEPSQRSGALQCYAREAENRTLNLLDEVLERGGRIPDDVVQRRLLESAAQDIGDLLPQLEARGRELAAAATKKLQQRGEREARSLHETLTVQRKRVLQEVKRHENDFDQLTLGFKEDERRQLESHMRSWRNRLEQFDADLEQEPQRISSFYEVQAERLEPVGLVYLWPDTN